MYVISSIFVFLIFYFIYAYIIIVIENLLLYPLYPAFIISFVLMILQYFVFPHTLLKLIKPALNDNDIPKQLEIFTENNNDKCYIWETKRPVIFHIPMPFSKNIFNFSFCQFSLNSNKIFCSSLLEHSVIKNNK